MKGFCVWMCWFVFVVSSEATKVRRIPWEELVVQSDFVGVVECTRAGGVVAVYRVIDPWKGSFKAGDEVRVKVYPDIWGPEFPAAYVGQRYLIAGDLRDAMTPEFGNMVNMPLWARQHDYDLVLPLFHGRSLLGSGRPLLHSEFTEIETFKPHAMERMSASPEEQEYRLMLRTALEVRQDEDSEELNQWHEALSNAKDLADVFRIALEAPDALRLSGIFNRAGGPLCLAYIVEEERVKKALGDRYRYVVSMLTRKVEGPPETQTVQPPPLPSADVIKEWRGGFAKGDGRENTHHFLKGLYELSEHEPERVLSWLMSWKNPNKDAFDASKGYRYGSVFCIRCGKERAKSFRKLLEAEDAFVRVAAAIYLTFEHEAEGIAALEQLESTLYYSEAGLWAALTLARRGDKTRMPRLLKHLGSRNPNSASVKGAFHGLMQTRTKVLLSNSGAASGVEIPDPILHGREKDHVILAWWAEHEADVTLADPWMPRLSAQRVD